MVVDAPLRSSFGCPVRPYFAGSGAERPLRSSMRVARKRAAGSSVKKQHRVLMSKLGLAFEGEKISEEALAAYTKLFEQPLS